MAASVAEALHYAHGRADGGKPLGIVHRDVKPANVMIAESGAVKLLDFGIALARMEGRDRTQTGGLKGTYAYLSPEQASRGALDGRSDLFSLGLLLAEMLTGRRVFDGGSDLDTVQKIERCATADVTGVTCELPAGLREICEKALAKSPDDRYQDGAEYSRALRNYLMAEGISYWPSDCAAEVRELGAVGGRGRHVDPETAAGEQPATVQAKAGEGVRPVDALEGVEPTGKRSGRGRAFRVAGSVLVLAALLALSVLLWGTRGGRATLEETGRAVAAAPSLGEPGSDDRARDAPAPTNGPPAPQAETVAPPTMPAAVEPVVRPKKRAMASKAASRRQDERRSGETHLQERAAAKATLPRGTLVRARLLSAVDPARSGAIEAVVAENVMNAGSVLVPAESRLVCTARLAKDGRVPVTCEGIATADRSWSFSGLAVGDGHHFGLRVVDTVVPAGTVFVVYVDAESR